ncbi:MAG: NAD(P)H-hydrate dehydratase [Solirubrobacteraceae bacterium]|nr:NAD(P)H-hydrate dehydratase [Patulibacter sp.]
MTDPTTALPTWLAPLLLPEELRASDAYAIEDRGIAGIELMERAGAALARVAAAVLPTGRIAVVCGPGNNGGDGFIAGRVLRELGRDVVVLTTRPVDAYRGDAAIALERLGPAPVPFASGDDGKALRGAAGVIDALLGTGVTGAPHGVELDAVRAMEASGVPVVACDLPSGIDAATGAVAGEAIRAVATVTFHRPSPGHLVHPAKDHVGALHVADIGIPAGTPVTPSIGALTDRAVRALPTRSADSHKYAAGAVVVLAGGAKYPGAGVLAVRGAQRGGAGYVTAVVSEAAVGLVRGAAPEAIVQPFPDRDLESALADLLGRRADGVVVGPGLGDDEHAEALVHAALGSDRPVVLDADGLAPFAGDPERLRRDAPLVLTPHAGELGRLLDRTSSEIGAGRLDAAREASRRSGAVVVLKGDDTIIATPDGVVAINDLSAPALATAGTGDVLAGATGAALASGVDPFLAACAAVRLHARAGHLAARRAGTADGIVAWDIAELLPAARAASGPARG